jgi:hypothetical protein
MASRLENRSTQKETPKTTPKTKSKPTQNLLTKDELQQIDAYWRALTP